MRSSILTLIAMLLVILAMILNIAEADRAANAPELEPYEIVDKYEEDGRCYVEIWHEVTPEEYIGLDIGDEYQTQD